MYMIVTLIVICLCFCLLELLVDKYPKAQRQIFNIAFLVIAVLCTARYAYGRDILNYIPFYNNITGSYAYNVAHDLTQFEPGFAFFCSVCKGFHLTYWGMTAVISILYWGAIYWLFSYIKTHPCFALLALVTLDHAVFLEQIRQCLAVALIIYAFCFYHKFSWKIIPLALLLISTTMHKTVLPFLFFLMVARLFYGLKTESKAYFLLAVLLVSFMVIALHPLLRQFVPFLPSSLQISVEYHLMVGKRIQKIFFLYFMVIICLGYYTLKTDADKREKIYHWLIWSMILVIVILYQYYLILYRIRSYILPFLLVWLLNTMETTPVKNQLAKQMLGLIMILFSISLTFELPKRYEKMKGQTDRVSWVWERRNHTQRELIDRQIEQAKLFWKYDNDKGLQMGFR